MDVWHFNKFIYRRALDFGETVHYHDQEFVIGTSGFLTSYYLTIAYSPAQDEIRSAHGVIVVVAESTDRFLLERHNASLVKAASRTLDVRLLICPCPTSFAVSRLPRI